ncbi:MAG TPA: tetratricopeptide repeat protein [Bryobacteraceae bacterium]|nr:tetratricopeptide repeat protein [Bryobacteraceae bacterium]
MRLLITLCISQLLLPARLGYAAAQQTENDLLVGRGLHRQGSYDEARVKLAAALRDAQADGSDTRTVALILDCMGTNEEDSGDFRQAEVFLNRGLSLIHPYAPHDPVLIALETHLAELYMAEVRPEDAEQMLRHSLNALRRASHPEPGLLSVVERNLALTCVMLHRYEEADKLLREAQALLESELGPLHPRLASGLFAYASLLTAEHKYMEAVAPAERAWKILHGTSVPVGKVALASACSALSSIYFRAGRVAEASSLALQAANLEEEAAGPNHPAVAFYLQNYAYILRHTGHKKEAKTIQKRAGDISQHAPSLSVGDTINIAALRNGSN